MIALRILFPLTALLLALTACTYSSSITGDGLNNSDEYKLVEIDAYSFRRAYHDHENYEGEALDAYMDRNPELMEDPIAAKDKLFYAALCETGLFQNRTLSLNDIDTLAEEFNLQVSPTKFLKVKTRYIEDPKEVEAPSFELTFLDKNEIVLTDTLAFDWPPAVTFMKADLDKDGSEELISIYQWYIVNGDNFDIQIYTVKK